MKDRNGGHTHPQDEALQRELSKLKAEHQRLRDEKLRAEQDAANLGRQMDELKARAEAEYGTSDPAELSALLEQRRAENAAMVADYRAHLETIRQELAQVEQSVAGNGDDGDRDR